jgi:hypothetical protein
MRTGTSAAARRGSNPRRAIVTGATLALAALALRGAEPSPSSDWRALPLITDGKVDPAWTHIGWGKFVVDEGALRTDCDPRGLGLLVYTRERLGNCQIRVVYKAREPRSNAGVYVRTAEGILKQVRQPGAAFERDAAGKITDASMERMKASGEREEGPWFAVHNGYEVQITDGSDPWHRTGSIYSLAPSSAAPSDAGVWRTLVITLDDTKIHVDLDGRRVSSFDPASPDLPPRKIWHEPKREPERPVAGFLGLQTHDPGDVIWFKEISVRPLPKAPEKPAAAPR